MDYEDNDADAAFGGLSSGRFRSFVCVVLSLLLGMQVYSTLWGSEGIAGDFSDIKYVVMQLTRGLSEVNRKHERLQAEMERVSVALPAVVAAAGRAKDALGPSLSVGTFQSVQLADYDRQVGDFALESAGARIVDTGNTVGHALYDSPVSWVLHVLTSWACRECQAARAIITPGALPGQCWAFKGARGEATIKLLGTIYVTGMSLEHIPALIDPTREILAAPRIIQLEGLRTRTDASPHDFGSFEYKKEGATIQYFEVQHPTPRGFNLVRVRVLANWGHPVYTCVYRVRVHGELLPGQAPRAAGEDELRVDNE